MPPNRTDPIRGAPCGSGTTGVAAVGKGRRFVGIDMDSTYLDLTKKRIDAIK